MTLALVDWIVMISTLLLIVLYGVWKTRNINNVKSYLLGDRDLPWWTIGLSIMATQASAITFLSTPGQAFDSGMGFAQFYFGMPIAMVLLSIFFLPIYYKLNVYTAYEYLEGRFNIKTRTLTAGLFLLSRGMSAGITIYAPSIILSTLLNWNLFMTNILMGGVVILYTVMGGTKAVSVTQKQQMIIILSGMIIAAVIIVFKFPADVSFGDAVGVAGKMGKLNVVDFTFDLSNRYTFWSGILGGVFLFLSYFGTDQSQVQRYLSGKSLAESRLGLLFNGLIKVPMQFLVLFVGILVFVFFQFVKPPLHFNTANVESVEKSEYYTDYQALEKEHEEVFNLKETAIRELITAIDSEDEVAISAAQASVTELADQERALQAQADDIIIKANDQAETKDQDYVFISFVINYLPIGLVGLLLAVIFSAAMSSTASELNALATTTVIDIYKRSIAKDKADHHYLLASKWLTIIWGVLALIFAETASLFENLIQAVNIVGSLFYGVILGIFMVAFFMKRVKGNAVFIAAIIGEAVVVSGFIMDNMGILKIGFLWFNLIGCFVVMILAGIIQEIFFNGKSEEAISPS
jgi:SSS family solute:Na+ symporter